MVALTQERIYFLHKHLGIIGMDVQSFSLARISSIDIQPGMFTSTLEIRFDNGTVENVIFPATAFSEWVSFTNQIRGRITGQRGPPQNGSPLPRSPIDILQEMYARGEISELEYQRRLETLRRN